MINTPVHKTTEPDIYTMLKSIVALASVTYGKELFFTFGTPGEIFASLNDMQKSNTTSEKKYPMIALAGEAPITVGDLTCYGEVTFSLIIATWSDINTKAEQRNEKNYNTTLLPVYRCFVDAVYSSNLFSTAYNPKFKHELNARFDAAKTNFKAGEIKLPESIDVLQINNIKLKIKK